MPPFVGVFQQGVLGGGVHFDQQQGHGPCANGMSRRVGTIRSQAFFFGRNQGRFVKAVVRATPHVMPLGKAPHLLKRPDSSFEQVHDGWSLLCRNFHAEGFAEHLGHIFDRFYRLSYGQSRVIAGFHWQSDVDASKVLVSGAYPSLHTNEAFMADMRKAQAEFKKLKAAAAKPAASKAGKK